MLQQVEIFQGLTPEELETLSATSTSRSFPKNTVVIHENDPADSLFVIESGKVKVYCSDKNGKEFIMNTQGTGDYFGELALLDDSTRSASVRTVEKSSFCIIYKEDFNRVLDEHPNIGRKLVRNLAQRVRKLTPEFMTYTIAKMGLWAMTQTTAQALTPAIRVNAIGPGPTLRGSRQSEPHFAAQRAGTISGRGANVSDITAALGYFLDAPAVTGQLLCVDGGQHLGWQTPDVQGLEN